MASDGGHKFNNLCSPSPSKCQNNPINFKEEAENIEMLPNEARHWTQTNCKGIANLKFINVIKTHFDLPSFGDPKRMRAYTLYFEERKSKYYLGLHNK